jgi:hypothetical protein
MEKVFICLLLLLSAAIVNFAQCEEPSIKKTGAVLAARDFKIDRRAANAETILQIEAAAENTSWASKTAESVILTIFVDEQYNQDVMLFSGAEKFVYKVVLGKFASGKHRLRIVLNEARSAKNARKAKISALDIKQSESKSDADALAAAYSPFIYARPDTIDKFSDIPVLTYYEILSSGAGAYKIRYTTIFTNEDGGTQTAALMARWGRATDIEWVYEIEVKNDSATNQIIQGANHVTKIFAGKRIFGAHPLIYNVTINNNFNDVGCSPLRTAILPIRVDLSTKSRETVMDENPWIYKIMAQEAFRENRVNPDKLDANTIADPRDYLYAEIHNDPYNAAIAVEAKTSGGQTISSDGGNKLLRVNRPGFLRIALLLPKTSRGKFPDVLTISCYPTINTDNTPEGECRNLNLIKVTRLDENFALKEIKLSANTHNIKSGEKSEFLIQP